MGPKGGRLHLVRISLLAQMAFGQLEDHGSGLGSWDAQFWHAFRPGRSSNFMSSCIM